MTRFSLLTLIVTPAGISIDDIPPGYSDYSGAMVSGNTRTFEMPQANIDGTVLGPFMKLYYYIVESCPSGNRAIAQYPSDAGKPLSLTQQAIPSISGGCSYKLIVQKDVSSLTMVQAYSPFVNNVDFQGTKDLEVINYLLQ